MSSRRQTIKHLIGFFPFAGLFCLISCLDPYSPPIIAEEVGILVVDGFFVGNDSSFFKLSRTQQLDSEITFKPELHAVVRVQGEDGSTYHFVELDHGRYGMPPETIDPSLKYKVFIRTGDSDEYESEFVPMKASHLIDSVTRKELVDEDAVQFYVNAHDPTNQTQYYYYTCDETWHYRSADKSVYRWENGQMVPRADATEIQDCYRTIRSPEYYITNTITLSDAVVHEFPLYYLRKYSRRLYFEYSILVKQYGLTEESYNYYKATKTNSEELGTLFDPVPNQPISNIRCITKPSEPVVGYFNASYLRTGRHFVRRLDVTAPVHVYEPTTYEEDCLGAGIALLEEMSDEKFEGMLIGDRVFDPVTFELIGYSYAPVECLDCRVKGGVLERPDYWQD